MLWCLHDICLDCASTYEANFEVKPPETHTALQNSTGSLPENVRAHDSLANTPHIGKYGRVHHQPVLNATLASGWVGSATVSWPVQGHAMALDLEELCILGLDEHHMCLVSHQLALLPLTIPEEPQQLRSPAMLEQGGSRGSSQRWEPHWAATGKAPVAQRECTLVQR